MDTTTQITEQFNVLPSVLQSFIIRPSWMTRVEAISNKHRLNDLQTRGLKQETLFVLLGLTNLSDYRANLVEELDITYDQALKISYDMNAQVFGLVMNELKQVEEGVFEQTPQEAPTEEDDGEHHEPESFLPPLSKAGVSGRIPNPDHMLMDHDEMEKVDGPHLHSQNVMPTQDSPEPTKSSFFSFNRTPKNDSVSIVDQKLNKIFKSSGTPTPTEEEKGPAIRGYGGSDPYREPLE